MAGTTFKLAPVDSTKHLYSGKYGANVMNSSPASLNALKVIVIAPAAPPVINKFLPAKLVPKRANREVRTPLRPTRPQRNY